LCYGVSKLIAVENKLDHSPTPPLFAVVPMLTVFLVIISSIKALEPARQQLQQLIYSNFLPKVPLPLTKH
jgi:hypothetical protein